MTASTPTTKPSPKVLSVNSLVIARLREISSTVDDAELLDAYASVIDHIEASEATIEGDPSADDELIRE